MDRIPVGFTLDGLQALRNQQATDDFTLGELQRKQAHEMEMDPLRVQNQQLSNMRSGQMVGEGEYSLASAGRKDASERMMFGATHDAKIKELLANASDNDAKLFENTIYQKLQTVRPGSPEHSNLMKALESTRGAIQEKRKHAHALEITKANNATQVNLEQMRIDAGKYQKANTLKVGFDYELSKADNAIKVNAVLTKYLSIAQSDPDYAPLIPTLNTMLERNRLPYEAEVDARRRGGVGGVDVGAATGIPTVPAKPVQAPPVPVPNAQPAPEAAPAPAAGDRVRVKGKDGKTGTIPRSQLQQAIDQGYVEIK